MCIYPRSQARPTCEQKIERKGISILQVTKSWARSGNEATVHIQHMFCCIKWTLVGKEKCTSVEAHQFCVLAKCLSLITRTILLPPSPLPLCVGLQGQVLRAHELYSCPTLINHSTISWHRGRKLLQYRVGRGGTLVEKEEVSREGGVQSSSQPKSPVVVIACPVHKVKVRAGGAGNGSVPAVSYLSVDVAHVEPLKIQAHLEEILVGTSERENE